MDNCLYKQTSYYSPGLIDDVTVKPQYLTCKTAISLSIPHVFCMTTTFFAAVFVLINQGRLSFYSISIVKTLTHLKLYFRTYLANTIGPRYIPVNYQVLLLFCKAHIEIKKAQAQKAAWSMKAADEPKRMGAAAAASGAPSATTASLRPFPFILRKQPSGGARQLYLGVKSL